jgi:hypothetical protein
MFEFNYKSTLKKKKMNFKTITVRTWKALVKRLQDFPRDKEWVFRGQTSDWPLATSYERACDYANIAYKSRPKAEDQIIRSFRRSYSGDDHDEVLNDRLYCMALMQHYGAPTRLLDFTYSPWIAAYNALEKLPNSKGKDVNVIWCLSGDWCDKSIRAIVGDELINDRRSDKSRDDGSFKKLYLENPQPFVFLENPFLLNTRLIVQQGVFLCPGDVSKRFEDNLKNMRDWHKKYAILKILCDMGLKQRCLAIDELYRMGISRASLYPGLQGFAESYMTRAHFYAKQGKRKVGK